MFGERKGRGKYLAGKAFKTFFLGCIPIIATTKNQPMLPALYFYHSYTHFPLILQPLIYAYARK
ncbi:MAG: hypothetical protein EAZ16_13760 [Sphingobacteriales bacterium]|nr:MAG: hypothetical protein EAZ16_13760 [Sphingobacteriales bacterium]